MESPSKGADDEVSRLKRKLAAAKLQDEKYDSETKMAETAELLHRFSQEVVSSAVNNVIVKLAPRK